MKNFLYIVITAIVVLWSCGSKGGGNTPPPTLVNHAPTTPTLVYPTNNLLCIENSVECKWNASSDSDTGDVITYQIEVAENSAFTQGKQTFNGTSLTQSISLKENMDYYWRVKASDSKDSSSFSTVFKFHTYGEGIENYVPFLPELVAPTLNEVVQTATATLQWTADDVDTTDTLTYDVYFGTDSTPVTLQSENQSATNLITPTLNASTTYYWKVVVKDGKGGQTVGQVWSFKTD